MRYQARVSNAADLALVGYGTNGVVRTRTVCPESGATLNGFSSGAAMAATAAATPDEVDYGLAERKLCVRDDDDLQPQSGVRDDLVDAQLQAKDFLFQEAPPGTSTSGHRMLVDL